VLVDLLVVNFLQVTTTTDILNGVFLMAFVMSSLNSGVLEEAVDLHAAAHVVFLLVQVHTLGNVFNVIRTQLQTVFMIYTLVLLDVVELVHSVVMLVDQLTLLVLT
tara:strand:- start:185 stop:502 length:318 start_codon:yes stop_codon:yes gene_type:complete